MLTCYLFRSNNHHVIAAAVRIVIGYTTSTLYPAEWQPSGSPFIDSNVGGARFATSYHLAPPDRDWVVMYPNIANTVPFAAALSRQTRKLTVSVVGERVEAWDRGHPAIAPDDLPTNLLDVRYFRDAITPPVANWAQWLHLVK